MSIASELEKVLGLTSMATPDQSATIAGLLAEVKSLEDHVAALALKVDVPKPEVVVAVPIVPAPADIQSSALVAEAAPETTNVQEASTEQADGGQQ